MPNAAPPVSWAARLVRSVARARAVVAADAPLSTAEGLARHGLVTWPGDAVRRMLVLDAWPLGRASAREGRTLARLLDLRVPLRAALAIALALPACTTVEDHRDLDVYPAEKDVATEPGQHLVTAAAACEPGDLAIGGGCTWGEPVDPHDPPLRPVSGAPEGEAFVCVAQNTGVGVELKTLRATATCLAGGAS